MPLVSYADTVDYQEQAKERKALPIDSNNIKGWPEGPEISAMSAVLMDVTTGTILYAKNIHEELYPASTTKIMTCLLAVENASLDDKIVFSNDAVFSVPNDGSNIGMDVGQSITLEQALYGIMVGSANEVANAVAEHVAGSIPAFINMMNDRAKELGCTHSHFVNANGLFNEDHYTSAHDLALIASAFFSNELLSSIGNTARYHFTPTATQPDDFYLNNKHKLITGEISYPGIVGGKTGYTDLARETLVTCAERDGMKLVCVVFMEESPDQFHDTVSLFDYGFNNFHPVKVADNETRYMPNDSLFFESENDVFGESGNILNLDENATVIIPKTAEITDTDYSISYDITEKEKEENPSAIARITYTYSGAFVGQALVGYEPKLTAASADQSLTKTIYINVKHLFLIALIFVVLLTITGIIVTRALANRKLVSKHDRLRYSRRKRESRKNRSLFKIKKRK